MTLRLALLVLGVFALVSSWVVTCQAWQYQKLAQDVAWLDDRSFESMTVITVGTGSAYENPHRLGPTTAIGLGARIVLIDAGRATAEALRTCAIRPAQPDTVLLTSLLPENVVGLDDLVATGWLSGRRAPLRVVGPPGTRALADAVAATLAPGLAAQAAAIGLPAEGGRIEALEVEPGWREERDGLALVAGAAGGRPLPALAWRLEAPGIAAVVSGSGPDPDALAAFAKGAAMLVAEGFFRQSVDAVIEAGDPDADRLRREADQHASIGEVAAVAERAAVPVLVLTRLRPPPFSDDQYEDVATEQFGGRVVVASECAEYAQERR